LANWHNPIFYYIAYYITKKNYVHIPYLFQSYFFIIYICIGIVFKSSKFNISILFTLIITHITCLYCDSSKIAKTQTLQNWKCYRVGLIEPVYIFLSHFYCAISLYIISYMIVSLTPTHCLTYFIWWLFWIGCVRVWCISLDLYDTYIKIRNSGICHHFSYVISL
jgi:hypothetical protein